MRTLIGGVGYWYLRDGSLGPAVAAELGRETWPADARGEDLSYGPIAVMQRLQGMDPPLERLVLVPALRGGRPPGPAVSARALELIRHVDGVHREGLARLVGLIGRRAPQLLDEAARDPVLSLLLALYDLAPAGDRGAAFIPLADLERSAAAARARVRRPSEGRAPSSSGSAMSS